MTSPLLSRSVSAPVRPSQSSYETTSSERSTHCWVAEQSRRDAKKRTFINRAATLDNAQISLVQHPTKFNHDRTLEFRKDKSTTARADRSESASGQGSSPFYVDQILRTTSASDPEHSFGHRRRLLRTAEAMVLFERQDPSALTVDLDMLRPNRASSQVQTQQSPTNSSISSTGGDSIFSRASWESEVASIPSPQPRRDIQSWYSGKTDIFFDGVLKSLEEASVGPADVHRSRRPAANSKGPNPCEHESSAPPEVVTETSFRAELDSARSFCKSNKALALYLQSKYLTKDVQELISMTPRLDAPWGNAKSGTIGMQDLSHIHPALRTTAAVSQPLPKTIKQGQGHMNAEPTPSSQAPAIGVDEASVKDSSRSSTRSSTRPTSRTTILSQLSNRHSTQNERGLSTSKSKANAHERADLLLFGSARSSLPPPRRSKESSVCAPLGSASSISSSTSTSPKVVRVFGEDVAIVPGVGADTSNQDQEETGQRLSGERTASFRPGLKNRFRRLSVG